MPCNDKNSLQREGTSLFNRVLSALKPGYAKIDDRQATDIILFAKRYAACLNYYDTSNRLTGNWQEIMQMDASVALAELSKIENARIQEYRLFLYKQIKLASLDTADPDKKTKKQFKFLFDFIFSLVRFIDEQYKCVPPDLSKKDILKAVICNKMSEALINLLALYNEYKKDDPGLIDNSLTALDKDNAPISLFLCKNFKQEILSTEWTFSSPLYSITDAISLPGKTASFTDKDRIVWLTNHNIFNAQIDNLFKGITFLSVNARQIFDEVIANYPKHSPHYALFLSFTRLFRIAQDDLNSYTQRHLDFYYKDVLQLKNKQPLPDKVHLTFELQKTIAQELLTKGTLFKGGKDITGKEIKYELTEDIVVTRATVDKLHSWQFTNKDIPGENELLKAAVIANSDDGESPAISSVDKSWFTFGGRLQANKAKVGFAVASNILFLNEGNRTITVQVNFKNDIPDFNRYATDCFTARVTGNKGWHNIKTPEIKFNSARELNFKFTLDPGEPPLIPYTEKIHKANLDISLPLIQVFLEQRKKDAIPYKLICNKQLSSVDVMVEVTDVKDLLLSHDNGPIDNSKPFKPFGDFPPNAASFYIGSKEVFQKKLTSVLLHLNWNSAPALNSTVKVLQKSKWDDSFTIDNGNSIDFTGFNGTRPDFEKNTPLQPNSINGFLRIQLNSGDFSYKKYLGKVSTQISLTTVAKNPDDGAYHLSVAEMPVPDEILLRSFKLDYVAKTSINFIPGEQLNNDLFFHFTPFGYSNIHPDHVDNAAATENTEHISMLPDISHAGELFIGLANSEPAAVINILFQVADGSSNPLKDIDTVSWYYLSNHNNWKKFRPEHIIDRTNNFTQPGIVTVTLPHKITNTNTAFEKGLHWIKAVVDNNTDAVCKMILVQAQAAEVQLQQDESLQVEFRKTLAANSISKLVVSNPSIKTITQPFDSFAGRVRELDEHFYVRVSERLRHKQRAITIWDYEHMVLEEFHGIFKVKCLNHSGFYTENNKEIFCENYPGHVTIITIPDQKEKTNINPLRPYTPIRILNNINQFLAKLNSPFVKLHVKNPLFEEIQLDFNVKFHEHLDESFYLQLLNTEIERFLCPWAWDQTKEVSFGGKIVKSVLLNFVEERPYVDYVTCFKMNHIIERNGVTHITEKQDVEEAVASTSMSVLVSYYNEINNKKHLIHSPALCDC